jgi:hypothetical protein
MDDALMTERKPRVPTRHNHELPDPSGTYSYVGERRRPEPIRMNTSSCHHIRKTLLNAYGVFSRLVSEMASEG